MSTIYHYTDEAAYTSIVNASDRKSGLLPSGLFTVNDGDSDYGTGWYVTPLPPTTPTKQLLAELWQSNPAKLPRTRFWIEMEVQDHDLTIPDPGRPSVGLIEYFRKRPSVDGLDVSVWGSGSQVLLLRGGRRSERGKNQVDVAVLFESSEKRPVVEAFIAGITGIRALNWRQRKFIREHYKVKDPNDSFGIDFEELLEESDDLYKDGNYAAALDAIDSALALEPRSADALSNKGAILAALCRRPEALIVYRNALEIDPEHRQTLRNVAATLQKLGDLDEAIKMCERALALDPQQAEILTNMGAIYAERGQDADALAAFDKAIEIDPTISQAWSNRAGIYANCATRQSSRRGGTSVETVQLINSAIDSYLHAIQHQRNYVNAREGLKGTIELSLGLLPQTWETEEAIWRSVIVDSGSFKVLARHLCQQGVEYHPRYIPIMIREGCDPKDSGVLLEAMDKSLSVVKTWNWSPNEILGPDRRKVEIGTCLLADLLGRAGLAKLPMRLGEIALESRNISLFAGTGALLQVAKGLVAAGIGLRHASAYDQALRAYQMASTLYDHCGDQKFVASMTFNEGVVYIKRNAPGDRERAITKFHSAIAQYRNGGFDEDRLDAERELAGILGMSALEKTAPDNRFGFARGRMKSLFGRLF